MSTSGSDAPEPAGGLHRSGVTMPGSMSSEGSAPASPAPATWLITSPHRLYMSKPDGDPDETTPLQDYAHLASLPTEPRALVKRLCHGMPSAADHTDCVFPIAGKLLANVAMPPRLQATFYRALATLPHIVVKRDVVDLAGRHDIAVAEAYPRDFQSEEILLDPQTYEYRGDRLDWTVAPGDGRPGAERNPPSVLVSPTSAQARHDFTETTRIAAGIVNRPGARP